MPQSYSRHQTDAVFYLQHGLLPALVMAVLLGLIAGFKLDSTLATILYDSQGQSWALKDYFWLETVIHQGGRMFFALLYIALLCCCLLPDFKQHRGPLVYLTLSIFIALVSINLLKKISGVPCPWSVNFLGGSQDMIEWFQGFNGDSGCFPAGHASSGYAWVALYFFALMVCPALKYHGLLFGMALGLIYGIAQQLRGAHFLSHDLSTLAVCWFVPMLIYPIFSSNLVSVSDQKRMEPPHENEKT